MGGIHALIGIGEGLITLGALAFLFTARRDLLTAPESLRTTNKSILIGGTLITLLLAVLSPFASSHPDGLEWVAEQHGFLQNAREAFYEVIPDYVMPGISNPALATIIAGILGAIIVFGVALGIARATKPVATQKNMQR